MFMRQEKNEYYYVYYDQGNGKRSKVSTKSKTVTKANAFFSDFRRKLEERKNNAIKSVTLKEFKKMYYEKSKNIITKGSLMTTMYFFDKIMKFIGEDILIKNIEQEKIHEFLNYEMKNRKLSTVKISQGKFIALIGFAKRNNLIPKSYYYEPLKIKVPERMPKYFTREQFIEFYQKCSRKDLRDICTISFLTGIREGDLIRLKWQNVDLKNNQILITIRKTNNVNASPLNELAVEVLKNRYLKRTDNAVFSYETKTHKFYEWSATYLYDTFKSEVRKIFGESCSLTFHSLRHGFASALVMSRVPIFTISKLLGHRNIRTTQIYTHFESSELKKATDLLNDLKINNIINTN